MLEHLGFGTFVFFGSFSLMGGLFVMFFVPETKGLTLEEMDEVFSDSNGLALADQERQDAIHRRLGLFTDELANATKNEKQSDLQEGDLKEE